MTDLPSDRPVFRGWNVRTAERPIAFRTPRRSGVVYMSRQSLVRHAVMAAREAADHHETAAALVRIMCAGEKATPAEQRRYASAAVKAQRLAARAAAMALNCRLALLGVDQNAE